MVIPDKIIRSRRKTVALQIDESGRLIVRTPLVCSDKRIADFIRAKEKWIVAKKAEAKQDEKPQSRKTPSLKSVPPEEPPQEHTSEPPREDTRKATGG